MGKTSGERRSSTDPDTTPALDDLAATAAAPEAAMEYLRLLTEARPALADKKEILELLVHLFAGSEYLSRWLLARPEEIDWIAEDGCLLRRRPAEEMNAHLEELLGCMAPAAALRRFKHRELVRIAARELSGAEGLERTLEEWSCVASAAIDAAVNVAEREAVEKHGVPLYTTFEGSEQKVARIAVLALGKLGGSELNISSDVDIMFVHSSDNGETSGKEEGAGKVALHEFFVKVAREATRLLNEHTEDGTVFRVDLELRPEGGKGEITNSIGAMEIYYESWGQLWERQALIKARHSGGDESVSKEVLERLRPFVYRKYLDQRAIDEIAAMKLKVDQSLNARKGVGGAARDIKLGTGGIREIEFITQALQLLYGARYEEMRARSTLVALDACEALGFLSLPHYHDLKEAYIFLRKLENRLQYHQLTQTHTIPQDEERLAVLGKLMGLDGDSPGEKLLEEVARRRKRVRAIFDLFFAKEKRKPSDVFPVPLDDERATAAWLDSIGFNEPEATARLLNVLRNGKAFTHPSERSKRAFDAFGPYLVAEAAEAPWPDKVILGFERFVEARGARTILYELLNSHRPVIKLLAAVFSSSERLTSILIKQPDILDRLLAADPVGRPADKKFYAKEMEAAASYEGAVEDKMTRLNSFRGSERLRLGVRRILGLSDRFELMEGLTDLAEEYLKAVAKIARAQVEAETGRPDDVSWTLLAAGKLGRREMNFGSDADMLVFYEGGEDAKAYVTKLTQTIIRLSGMMTPYGAGYPLDMRLRPDGEGGPLTRSYHSMLEYYKNRGQVWERIALVGARPVTGDEEFSARVMEAVYDFITNPPLREDESKKIADIRERIAREKVKRGAIDIKFGRGGLIEIEFICQWLLLEKGLAREAAFGERPLTISTLERARREGWLSKKDADKLIEAYTLYRGIEDAVRMDREQAVNTVPQAGIELRRVARSAGAQGVGPERFLDVVKERMEEARGVYLEFIKERGGASSEEGGG